MMMQSVTLAGKSYDVAPLPIRHIRAVLPLSKALADLQGNATGVSREMVDALYAAARVMIRIVDPAMTDESYEDLHISPGEIARALPVFIMQAGLERKADAPGEAAAGSGDQTTTGRISSPTSPSPPDGPSTTS